MNKKCGRCDKIVYPTEELKCLDKVWHKGCFKCQECGMTLNMKTYKGYDKLPYCDAHVPKAKATTVAETPEMKRLAENTKIQSNVRYHAEFEKNKAKFTQVADDPETMRIRKNMKIISNATYHGDLEKKALAEKKMADQAAEGVKAKAAAALNEEQRKAQPVTNQPTHHQTQPVHHQTQPVHHQTQPVHHQTQPVQHQTQPVHPQSQSAHHQSQNHYYQAPTHQQPQTNQPYQGGSLPSKQVPPPQHSPYYQQQQQQHAPPNSQSYFPTNMSKGYHHHPQQNAFQDTNHNSPYSASRNSQTLIYSSQSGGAQQHGVPKNVGSIADYDPMNDQYGSISSQKRNQQTAAVAHRQETTYQAHRGNMHSDAQGMHQPVQQKVSAPPTHLGRVFRAMYDYEAADTDEVSFRDGDLLINCTSIDEGWMTGTVQRNGRAGMLPANYVERVS